MSEWLRCWLYDPRNDYKGRIFEGEAIIEALGDGWETAPYPGEKQIEKEKTIDIMDSLSQGKPLQRKPGRKPNASRKR